MQQHRPQKNVLFAIPSLNYHTAIECTGSLCQTSAELIKAGIPHAFRFRGGNCFVDAARNLLAADLLDDPQYTDIFYIDDDVGFEPAKVLEFILSPKDVISGVYPKKNDELVEFPCILKQGDDEMPIERDGLYQAVNIPGGFMRIKRHVMERLAEESQQYEFVDKGIGERLIWNIFEMGPRTDQNGKKVVYWGEDSIFAKKVIDAGFEIWIDPKIGFTHRGQKRWEGRLQDSVDLYVQQLNDKRNQAVASLKAVA